VVVAALAFAYIERIFGQEDRAAAVKASIATLEGFLPKLREVGFLDMVIDDSYEIPRDLINGIVDSEPVSNNGATLTPAQLLEVFRDDSSTSLQRFIRSLRPFRNNRDGTLLPAVSNYLVTFMRMITSAQIRSNAGEYEGFLTHPDTGETIGVKEFCETVVEVLGKEAGE
jgi:ubiquitin thioesterase protein OTUB1